MLSSELSLAVDLARRAGALVVGLRRGGLSVEHKAGDEPVTEADRAASRLIVEGLHAAFPHDAILSEEAPDDDARLTAPRVWMIDPIDGTKDFIRGETGFACMIGLLVEDRPSLGVVYQPAGDRLYRAVAGEGAWIEEAGAPPRRIHVSEVSRPEEIRMVASKSHRDERIDQVRQELGITDELNVGSVGLKLGLIARGERDLYVNPAGRSSLWDALAPEVILTEAGGRLSDTTGAPLAYRGKELKNSRGLIASNSRLHDEVVRRLAAMFAGGIAP